MSAFLKFRIKLIILSDIILQGGLEQVNSIDSIVGVIHEKDFFNNRTATSLREIMKPPLFVTPTSRISDLLHTLQKAKSHMAIVSDEYGGTMGIVTMEDIIEELVGEIYDEHDQVVESFKKLPDGG